MNSAIGEQEQLLKIFEEFKSNTRSSNPSMKKIKEVTNSDD